MENTATTREAQLALLRQDLLTLAEAAFTLNLHRVGFRILEAAERVRQHLAVDSEEPS